MTPRHDMSINKRWASIKSMVKERRVSVVAGIVERQERHQSPNSKRFSMIGAMAPERQPSTSPSSKRFSIVRSQSPSPSPKLSGNRRMSLVESSHLGIKPNSAPKFEIPKTIAELKSDLQEAKARNKPNRKLLRLNTEHNLLQQKSAPSSPMVSTPIKINDKRRLTIAPILSGGGGGGGSAGAYSSGSSFCKTPSPKRSEREMMRSRRSSIAPMVSINIFGAEEDEQDGEPMNFEDIHLTLSPSGNSMSDPKYWDQATPDHSLRLKPPQRDRLYNRRRSSALSNLSNEPELSRSTYSLCEKGLYDHSKEKILNDRRLSLAPQLAISQIVQRSAQSPKRTRSSNRLEARLIADMGELKLSVQYQPEKPGLKVTVMKGENIGGKYKTETQINAVVSVCLLPGKLQKQTGKVVKGTKNPVFNDEFFFSDMNWEMLENHMLRVCVQNQNRFKNEDLGEILLPLMRLEVDVDNRMWKDLRKKCQNPTQECGYLQIRTRFTKQTKKLTVLVIKAQDLLRSSLIGPPDTFVRVEVMQNERRVDRKATKIVKRTKDPLYKEAFSFVLGVSLEEIKYTTIEITVYAKEKLFGSTALGQVILGYGSTEESELRHWSLTMREYGKEFTKWHSLMPLQSDSSA